MNYMRRFLEMNSNDYTIRPERRNIFAVPFPIIKMYRYLQRRPLQNEIHHYISFVAAVSSGDMQMVKLYPEGSAEARFKIRGVRRIFFYCNRDGLFSVEPVKGVDDKESGYDDSQERRELEKAAVRLKIK